MSTGGHSGIQVYTCMNSNLKYTHKHNLVMMQKSTPNKDFVGFCLKFDPLRIRVNFDKTTPFTRKIAF